MSAPFSAKNCPHKLKMSTMDRVLREHHFEHGTSERGTVNEVHRWLSGQFGHIGTVAGLRRALEISGGYLQESSK